MLGVVAGPKVLTEIRQAQDSATRIIVVPGNGEYAGQELADSRGRYRAGVAATPEHAATGDELYMAADVALAEAVESGSGVVEAR